MLIQSAYFQLCVKDITLHLGQVYEDQGGQEGGGRHSGWADCWDVQQPGGLHIYFCICLCVFDDSVSYDSLAISFSLTLNPQDIIKNQNKDKKPSPEDDFDFWTQLQKVIKRPNRESDGNPWLIICRFWNPVKRIRLYVPTIAIWKYTRHEEIYI